MGVSTDGQICFGIAFEEGSEFPWDRDEDADWDIEDWWRRLHGWNEFWTEADIGYFDRQGTFDAEHPMPVQLVMHCSYDYPMYILSLPGTLIRASRGYPAELPSDMGERDGIPLIDFCEEHGIELSEEQKPCWLLTSLWG